MQKKLSPWCKKAKIAMIQNDISYCADPAFMAVCNGWI